jgi:hypothetical protein
MIMVLLLTVVLVLGGLGLGVYLLFRPDPGVAGTPAPRSPGGSGVATTAAPPTTAPPTTTATTTTTTTRTTTTSELDTPEGGATQPRSGDPRAVARDYVGAVNDRDETAATGLTCDRADAGTLFPLAGDREVALREVEVIEDTVASATVRIGDEETALLLENQENGWCVSI